MKTLTPKETSLLKDLRSQEELCVEKYRRHAQEACDQQLKDLFTRFEQQEQQHIQTLDSIASGTVPGVNAGGAPAQEPTFTASRSGAICP